MRIHVTFSCVPAFRSRDLHLLMVTCSCTKDLEGAGLLSFTCSIKQRHLKLKWRKIENLTENHFDYFICFIVPYYILFPELDFISWTTEKQPCISNYPRKICVYPNQQYIKKKPHLISAGAFQLKLSIVGPSVCLCRTGDINKVAARPQA